MVKTQRSRLIVAIVVAALALPGAAAELTGSVRSVSGEVVTIRCDGGASPNPGDPVRIGFDVPGVGFVPLEGLWKVSLIGPGGEVQATSTTAEHGQPQAGHIALIETAAPVAGPAAGPARQNPATPAGPAASTGSDRSGLPPIAQRPWMGLRLERTETDATSGVAIVAVRPNGPAARAGVRAGDVILAVGGSPTPNSAALERVTKTVQPGKAIVLRLLRLPDVVEVSLIPELPSLDDPAVQNAVGYAFLTGNEITADEAKGVEWLERAAALGDPDAVQILDAYRNRASAGGKAVANQPSGVYIAGTEEGKRPAWFILEAGIYSTVAATGAPVRDLPPDIWPRRNNLSSPEEVFRSLQPLGGGWLLWVDVSIHWGKIGFAKDRVVVQCYDPAGHLQWEEEASNVMAQSADHSVQLVADKINKKLAKKRGKACLRP
jgi:TPR repeat protein